MYLQEQLPLTNKKSFSVVLSEKEIKDIRAVLYRAYMTYICKAEDCISPSEKKFAMRDAEIVGEWVNRINQTLDGECADNYVYLAEGENRFAIYLDNRFYVFADTFPQAVSYAKDLRETLDNAHLAILDADCECNHELAEKELLKLACQLPVLPHMRDLEDYFDWSIDKDVITIQDTVTEKKWDLEGLPY